MMSIVSFTRTFVNRFLTLGEIMILFLGFKVCEIWMARFDQL